jgi:hypothetical protein
MADFPGLWAQLLDQRADTLTTVPGR